jgi:hypothetical protein
MNSLLTWPRGTPTSRMPSVMGSDHGAPCVPIRAAKPLALHVIVTGRARAGALSPPLR